VFAKLGIDAQCRNAASQCIGPVELAVVQSHAVDHVVDSVELSRRRVHQIQRVDRFAVYNSNRSQSTSSPTDNVYTPPVFPSLGLCQMSLSGMG